MKLMMRLLIVFLGIMTASQAKTYEQSEFGKFLSENGEEYVYESIGQNLAIEATKDSSKPTSSNTFIIKKAAQSGFRKAAFTVLGAFGVATIWYGAKSLWTFIDRQIAKPTIIMRSHKPLFGQSKSTRFHKPQIKNPNPLILPEALQARIDQIIQNTKVTFEKIKDGTSNLKYRNLMLLGPSGNGKSTIATKIAESSGMEFAMVNGASFAKPGALEVLDDLFKWAEKKRGLILVIENADALIIERNSLDPASPQYKVLSSFLTYTSTRSDKWMIIFTTNRAQGIDPIIANRIDDVLELPLPCFNERMQALKAYRDHIFVKEMPTIVEHLTEDRLQEIAVGTSLYTYADLEGFINTLKVNFECSADKVITEFDIKAALAGLREKYALFNQQVVNTQNNVQLEERANSLFVQFLEWLVASRHVEPIFKFDQCDTFNLSFLLTSDSQI